MSSLYSVKYRNILDASKKSESLFDMLMFNPLNVSNFYPLKPFKLQLKDDFRS